MNRLIIIDGNAIVHRAYHALPPLTTKDGKMVNAVYGFASMLLKVWKDLKPTHIAVTFDMAGPTFRHVKFEKYKATRVKADQELYDQIPLTHELVRAFGLAIYEKKGYEADDVIGTIVEKTKYNGAEIFIVTGDKDTLQLVGGNVKVYTLRKGMSDIAVYDTEEVRRKFGFGPELVVDYKALAGDSSDNIPGVPGIGEKTATELIQKFGGVEEIYKEIGKLKDKGVKDGVIKKLEAGEESARMSKELATLDCDVPGLDFKFDDCKLRELDKEKIVKLFSELEFISLLKRVPEFAGSEVVKSSAKGGQARKAKDKEADFKFSEIGGKEELGKLKKLIREKKIFACRVLSGLVFVAGREGFFVKKEMVGGCDEIFADKELELVGHDLKQLVKALGTANVKNKLFDVMVASYLLAPGSRAHGAADIVFKVLGKELPAGVGQESLFGVDARTAARELLLLAQAADKLKAELVKIDDYGLFQKVEMPLVSVLAEMEIAGVAVDLDVLSELSEKVNGELKSVSKKIYKMAGEEFNIASPLQLREILFDKMAIPTDGIKKGKTGLSTSAEELEKMRGLHPIIEEIENYRELAKLQNTYIDVLPTLVDKKTGRIHTTFNQTVAATGRLSSSDPNLQNIPIRTELGQEVRKAFVAEKGNLLVGADYSQIELRIVASLAEDKRMIEIFEAGEDIHQATAAAINGVPLEKVTKEMRRAAKEVNFGVLYGMGVHGLSWRAGIPYAQAKDFITKYFEQFSGVKKYIDRTLELARKDGYCETLFGRRRYIPELNSDNHQLAAAAERMAINHPIQGTAADLIKMAMIAVYDSVCHSDQSPKGGAEESLNASAKLILQVHDELILEAPTARAEAVAEQVKKAMEGVVKLRVPVEAHVKTGKSWWELK